MSAVRHDQLMDMRDTRYFSFSGKALIERIRVSWSVRGVGIVIDHDDCGPHSRVEMFDIETIGM